jgi:hypothetical protein
MYSVPRPCVHGHSMQPKHRESHEREHTHARTLTLPPLPPTPCPRCAAPAAAHARTRQLAQQYCSEIFEVLRTLRRTRDMSVAEVKLVGGRQWFR